MTDAALLWAREHCASLFDGGDGGEVAADFRSGKMDEMTRVAVRAEAYRAGYLAAEAERDKLAKLVARLERRERQSTKYWMRAAKVALAGDMRELRNRVEMHEAAPVEVVLSSLRNTSGAA